MLRLICMSSHCSFLSFLLGCRWQKTESWESFEGSRDPQYWLCKVDYGYSKTTPGTTQGSTFNPVQVWLEISPYVIYQTAPKRLFVHISYHKEKIWKYNTQWVIFGQSLSFGNVVKSHHLVSFDLLSTFILGKLTKI